MSSIIPFRGSDSLLRVAFDGVQNCRCYSNNGCATATANRARKRGKVIRTPATDRGGSRTVYRVPFSTSLLRCNLSKLPSVSLVLAPLTTLTTIR
jgi:hypothetical protein